MGHPPPANEAALFSHQGCHVIKISRYNIDCDIYILKKANKDDR